MRGVRSRPNSAKVCWVRTRLETWACEGCWARMKAPVVRACSAPESDSSMSEWPCSRCALFHSVSPWRTNRMRIMDLLGISRDRVLTGEVQPQVLSRQTMSVPGDMLVP
ncbi:hypothetical protein BG28_07705 [Nesterenkonia sp. AN1]|nr:hypothetical protein BG28_07705 [Nesterenkonia sp. AN1]